MRTLVLEPAGNLWGSERVLLDFLRNASASHEEIAICCPPQTPLVSILNDLSIKVFPTFTADLHYKGRIHRMAAAISLAKVLQNYRPQLLYVNQAGATKIALLACHLFGIPVITHVRLAEDVEYIAGMNSSRSKFPKIICISNFIAEKFSNYNVEQGRITVLYDLYSPTGNIKLPVKNLCEHKTPNFVCVGRIVPQKGQDVALRALAHLGATKTDANLKFIGSMETNKEYSNSLLSMTTSLHIDKHVIWAGYQDNVYSHISASTALICPSHCEPLGRVIFEAWDAGTIPIAWAGSGGAAEIIEASGGGLLYQEQNGESLAHTLIHTIALSAEKRSEIISKGREWVQANCNSKQYVSRMTKLWREVIRAE